LAIVIVACSLIFWYWDVGRITWEWFGELFGVSSSFTDSWKSRAPQITVKGDDRWDFLWSSEPSESSTVGNYATEDL
jgi:hypothetical protein